MPLQRVKQPRLLATSRAHTLAEYMLRHNFSIRYVNQAQLGVCVPFGIFSIWFCYAVVTLAAAATIRVPASVSGVWPVNFVQPSTLRKCCGNCCVSVQRLSICFRYQQQHGKISLFDYGCFTWFTFMRSVRKEEKSKKGLKLLTKSGFISVVSKPRTDRVPFKNGWWPRTDPWQQWMLFWTIVFCIMRLYLYRDCLFSARSVKKDWISDLAKGTERKARKNEPEIIQCQHKVIGAGGRGLWKKGSTRYTSWTKIKQFLTATSKQPCWDFATDVFCALWLAQWVRLTLICINRVYFSKTCFS